jgi:hypothetical protein
MNNELERIRKEEMWSNLGYYSNICTEGLREKHMTTVWAASLQTKI